MRFRVVFLLVVAHCLILFTGCGKPVPTDTGLQKVGPGFKGKNSGDTSKFPQDKMPPKPPPPPS
jgi:hypothetical protein